MGRRGGWEWKRVLIIVKTYPNPSTKYREIVCTAGIDQETGGLIRLYPIQFRSLEQGRHFEKWQFIDVRVRKASGDHRRESYEVEQESITPGEQIPAGSGWSDRWQHIKPLISPSLEYLKGLDESERPSLGIIKPSEFEMLITAHRSPEYTAKERRKLLGTLGFNTLFGDRLNEQANLEKIPLKFQYRYRCNTECAKAHIAFFEDWEVGEAWRKWRTLYPEPEELKDKIRFRFADEPREKDNLYLVLGTHSRFRETWLAIGHFRPILSQMSVAPQLSFTFK